MVSDGWGFTDAQQLTALREIEDRMATGQGRTASVSIGCCAQCGELIHCEEDRYELEIFGSPVLLHGDPLDDCLDDYMQIYRQLGYN